LVEFSTAILLALRLIYEENMERLGLEQDAVCTVRDVLEKHKSIRSVHPCANPSPAGSGTPVQPHSAVIEKDSLSG